MSGKRDLFEQILEMAYSPPVPTRREADHIRRGLSAALAAEREAGTLSARRAEAIERVLKAATPKEVERAMWRTMGADKPVSEVLATTLLGEGGHGYEGRGEP